MASEIRVDKINSLSGVGTVTLSPTGVDIAGITTAATLRATTGIVTSLTAGSLTSLGAVSGTTGTFSGAISGTTGTFTGDVDIAAHIKHTGDTDTKISFDTNIIHFDTANVERLRILSDGNLQVPIGSDIEIGQTASSNHADGNAGSVLLGIQDGGGAMSGVKVTNVDAGTYNDQIITFLTAQGGVSTPTERFRIKSDGKIGIGTTNPQGTFQIESTDPNFYITNQSGNLNPSNAGTIHFREAPATASFFITHNGSTNKLVLGSVNGGSTFSHISLDRGNANIEAGANIVIPNGNGIDFSAAGNAGGMTSELLDDYEEGVYTATSTNATWNTSQNQVSYTKIGRLVTVTAQILQLGGSGNLDVLLPFTAAAGSKAEFAAATGVAVYNQDLGGAYTPVGLISAASNLLQFLVNRNNTTWTHLSCDAGAYVRFSISYVAA